MRKEGSESELASYTHVKGYLVHALKLWQYTSAEKTFRHLAPPNLALARLQSLAITLIRCQLCIVSLTVPTHAKNRNAPLLIQDFATPPRSAHAHMNKRRYTLHLQSQKHCAIGSCHLGPWFLHTSSVYDLALIIHLGRHGALLRFNPHQKGGVIDNQMQPCHHCNNSKTFIHIRCW